MLSPHTELHYIFFLADFRAFIPKNTPIGAAISGTNPVVANAHAKIPQIKLIYAVLFSFLAFSSASGTSVSGFPSSCSSHSSSAFSCGASFVFISCFFFDPGYHQPRCIQFLYPKHESKAHSESPVQHLRHDQR